MAKGILYVMTTIVKGLVKIGKTGTNNFESRMYTLEHNGYANVTGLKRRFAIEVEDYDEKENLLDTIFNKSNVVGTELFAVDVNIVVQLLSSFEGKVVYPKSEDKEKIFDDATSGIVEKSSTEIEKIPTGKAKRFKFSMVGISEGEELTYVKNPSVKVKVADDGHVFYCGQKYSMSTLVKVLSGVSKPVQGPHWFAYKGKRLTDLRSEKEKEAMR